MKKVLFALLSLSVYFSFISCSDLAQDENSSKLNETQIEILAAEGLPTDYDELTVSQQYTIDRIDEMLSYLNEKYEEPFIYADYIPQELLQTETLIAYPRSTGSGDGKYLVTVKAEGDSFTDDYFDFSVSRLAEELTNDFLAQHFDSDEYKYFALPLACSVDMAEMENCKFQWKYGASNRIFLLESECSIDNVEEFAVEYAKWLYEHELSGTHRIQILSEFPEDEKFWADNGGNVYMNYDRLCTGFYSFHMNSSNSEPNKCYTIYVKYDQNAEKDLDSIFHISKEYYLEEFLNNNGR